MMVSEFSKHSRKSLLADGIRQDITNKLRHRKWVRLEMSINTYLEVQSKETTQKRKFNKHLKDIISNKL